MSTIIGAQGMIEQSSRIGSHPKDGPFTIRTWRGDVASAASLTAQLTAARFEWERSDDGATAVVTARIGKIDDGADETPVKSWEVAINTEQKSILRFEKVLALGQSAIDALKTAVDANDPSQLSPTGDQAKAYAHMSQGVDSYLVEGDVLRQTQTVSTDNVASFRDLSSVGKIFSPAQLIAIGCPSSYVETLTPPDTSAYGYTLLYGYKKRRPPVTELAGGKSQIVTEYEQGFWTNWIYSAA